MYKKGTTLFGKPDEYKFKNNTLYRYVYSGEGRTEVVREEKVISKEEFVMCYKEWISGKENE